MPKKLSDNPAAIEAAVNVLFDSGIIRQSWENHKDFYPIGKQILLAAERAARQFDSKAVEAAEKAEGKQ